MIQKKRFLSLSKSISFSYQTCLVGQLQDLFKKLKVRVDQWNNGQARTIGINEISNPGKIIHFLESFHILF